ncbi:MULTISPECIES: YceD family protein [Exiguobacterium]|uniref:Uncharacterized ACR, COG1399 n=1 Tax=Exiguobacterium aurantiacum TaxID=33987 RepID=A0A377FUS2_9BACL|nr:YceD family protein [Exiguobacterium aurantiacum]STO08557.1 Uncharacterized ACR, COG1399 [Exiguobacterium aurantiacum]
MKWSIAQLLKLRNQGDSFSVDETVELPELIQLHPDIRSIRPVHVHGDASFTSNQVTFNLKIQGDLTLPDARTLDDVMYEFDIESLEPFFLENGRYTEQFDDVNLPEGNTIDLRPIVRELIMLDVPMQVFGNETDKTQVEGEGWALVEDQLDDQPKIDPRLAGLADLFSKKEDENG